MNRCNRFVAWALAVLGVFSVSGCASAQAPTPMGDQPSVAGVYPHLAMMNNEGECGTGAVVPWAGRLWAITYAPHMPLGSSDKLYEITPSLEQIIRPESIGGTPANRMIHNESQQLNIGPYFIDAQRNVRTIPYAQMPGRPTASARHLTDPAGHLYITTMEEGLYEVDVNTLDVTCWINNGFINNGQSPFPDAVNSELPGYHGKGTYLGQGQLIYANNGDRGPGVRTDPTTPSGALAAWGGPGNDWQLILREQFTEVTGPGGIHGNPNPDTDPVWSMGWDHRSVILALLDGGEWHTYRLPKASFSYDGAHGWNTEWPRIREIGTGDDLLATMHGTFWHFPQTFSRDNSAGIAPRSNYLKVVGDFARWGDWVVLGCDDSAQREFLNTRDLKSERAAPLRSNSNLWFVTPEQLSTFGPALGSGGVWLDEDVEADTASDPFLFTGYDNRMLHLEHHSDSAVNFVIEVDRDGNNQWQPLRSVRLNPDQYFWHVFTEEETGQWVRIRAQQSSTHVTAWFHYADDDERSIFTPDLFRGLAMDSAENDIGGAMRSLGGDDIPMGLIAQARSDDSRPLYLINEQLELVPSDDDSRRGRTWQARAPDPDTIPMTIEGNSVLVIEDGQRWRLPLNPGRAEDQPFGEAIGFPRRVREVVTERDLLNVAGTFYELPARNAGGFAHVRPISSHPFRIHDFCTNRGLLYITGIDADAMANNDNERILCSEDGNAAVWVGVVDDLWQMGHPRGVGGPWHESEVTAGEPSDPYLMYGYERKLLQVLSNQGANVTIQVDPSGTGSWHDYETFDVVGGVVIGRFEFPDGFNAHWVRLISDSDATITAEFVYD